jgi:hypothetical protein
MGINRVKHQETEAEAVVDNSEYRIHIEATEAPFRFSPEIAAIVTERALEALNDPSTPGSLNY